MDARDSDEAASSAPGLVKDLVDQFSDPLAFYRELIQNAIDAGANRIDVTLSFLPEGAARIAVEDDGEGMDEPVIDDYYLVLFRSAKEADFTKIGKFGIGVMSMFSLRPELVRVHTGKSGESWRLDFRGYEQYEKYRIPEMRDGTLVELFKRVPAREFEGLAAGSLAAVRFWCRHSDTRIYFRSGPAGEAAILVNEPFGLKDGESLRYSEEGTEVVLGFSAEPEPFFGFYNKGLTLKEGCRAFFTGVTFKIKSRYLEHTLTRDNVLEDENHGKAMAIVGRLVEEALPLRLKVELAAISGEIAARARAGQPPDPALDARWAARLPFARRLLSGFVARWKRSEWPLFPSVTGEVLSLEQLKASMAASGRVIYVDDAAGDVARRLASRGWPVLVSGPWAYELAGPLLGAERIGQASKAFAQPEVIADRETDEPTTSFLRTLNAVETSAAGRYRAILAGRFDEAGAAGRWFVAHDFAETLIPVEGEPPPPASGAWGRRVLVNAGHPLVRSLVALHAGRPGLAAFLCLKMMRLLDADPAPQEDEGKLLAAALAGLAAGLSPK